MKVKYPFRNKKRNVPQRKGLQPLTIGRETFWGWVLNTYSLAQVAQLEKDLASGAEQYNTVYNYWDKNVNKKVTPPRTRQELDFWAWAGQNYYDEELEYLFSTDYQSSAQWDYFLRNIYREPAEPAEDLGPRYQPDKAFDKGYWDILLSLHKDPDKLQDKLDEMYDAGLITKWQHEDIFNEVYDRVQKTGLEYMLTSEKERADVQRAELEKEKEQQRLIGAQKFGEQLLLHRTQASLRGRTDYGPAFEQVGAEFGGAKTERWRQWFQSQFPTLTRQYESLYPVGGKVEKTDIPWPEWLKKKKPEIREQWHKQTPYERGERPSAFQPRITTVRF